VDRIPARTAGVFNTPRGGAGIRLERYNPAGYPNG